MKMDGIMDISWWKSARSMNYDNYVRLAPHSIKIISQQPASSVGSIPKRVSRCDKYGGGSSLSDTIQGPKICSSLQLLGSKPGNMELNDAKSHMVVGQNPGYLGIRSKFAAIICD